MRTVERIKAVRPDATIGADLIAGFPTETEEMALNTLKLLDDLIKIRLGLRLGMDGRLHFTFSMRPD